MTEQSKRRILVVDDDPVDRRAVFRALRERYDVVEASDGDSALEVLEAKAVDCVLLDYEIPGTDTLDLLRQMNGRIPVVTLTGQSGEHVVRAVMKAGAEDYVSKHTISPQLLDETVRQAMESGRRRRARRDARARLQSEYRQEKAKRQEMEMALRIASDIQQQLVPSAPPDIDGYDIAGIYLPADETGGDSFDYVRFPDGSLGVLVGDVSGHGIGPALLAAEVRAAVRALSRSESDVVRVAQIVNELLYEDTTAHRFTTFLLAKLHAKERSLTYTSAGQPVYVIRDSSEAIELDSHTIPLGLEREIEVPPPSSVQLESGDVVLISTDGLWEMRNPDQQMLGIEPCLRIVEQNTTEPAERIINRLVAAARGFANGRQHDDLTIVVLRAL